MTRRPPPRASVPPWTVGDAAISALLGGVVATVVVAYVADRLGRGPAVGASVTTGAAVTLLLARRHWPLVRWSRADVVTTAGLALVLLALTVWLAAPSGLPPGSGPDLTHHLLLIDTIERYGTTAPPIDTGAYLGEMADYTPGLHWLTVIAARLAGTSGMQALYPVIAGSVVTTLLLFHLVVRQLLDASPAARALSVAAVAGAVAMPTYALGAFIVDSFLAQVAATAFAMAMWWALVWWQHRPDSGHAALVGLYGVGAALTWPVWLGPPLAAFVLLLLTRRDLGWPTRVQALALAAVPPLATVLLHATGRGHLGSLAATSGAVADLSPTAFGWALLVVAAAGIAVASRAHDSRPLAAFAVAVVAQIAALYLLASLRDASTPYMALKTVYLGVYPALAAVALVLAVLLAMLERRAGRSLAPRALAWALTLAVAAVACARLATIPRGEPMVSLPLAAAGAWARDHLPSDCVDYLVANEFTAYWLHLVALGNPRASARSGDDATYLPDAVGGRWLERRGLRYAIVRLDRLPVEVRDDVDVLYVNGDAAVVASRYVTGCPGDRGGR